MSSLYLLKKIDIDTMKHGEKCICDSSYLMPNIQFLLSPVNIQEINIDGKIIYPDSLACNNDSLLTGRKPIQIKLINGKTIIDSICLEEDCSNYDIIINDEYNISFEPSTYD